MRLAHPYVSATQLEACARKMQYRTRLEAEAHLKALRWRYQFVDKRLAAYQCEVCFCWHLGRDTTR